MELQNHRGFGGQALLAASPVAKGQLWSPRSTPKFSNHNTPARHPTYSPLSNKRVLETHDVSSWCSELFQNCFFSGLLGSSISSTISFLFKKAVVKLHFRALLMPSDCFS